MDRRTFLGHAAVLAGLAFPRRGAAQTAVRLGLVVPEGPMAESVGLGARLGLDDANALAGFFGKRLEVIIEEPAAGPSATAAAAARLARDRQVLALIGGADDGSAEALADAARQDGVLFFNVAAASDRLRGERCHRLAFHVAPSAAMLVGAVGLWLTEERRLARWALVTSASPFGRDVEEAAAAFLARRGGAVLARERLPAGADGASAVLRDLRAAAPEAVLAGLDRSDVLAFVREYRAAGLAAPLAGVTPDPGVLLTADPDALAGVWPLAWHHDLARFSARELNGRFRRRLRRPMDGPTWATWAAIKLVGEGIVRSGAADAAGLVKFIESAPPFDGHKGQALTFREWDHQLRQPLYLAAPRRETGGGRIGALAVLGDVPRGSLDALAPPRSESRCRLEP